MFRISNKVPKTNNLIKKAIIEPHQRHTKDIPREITQQYSINMDRGI